MLTEEDASEQNRNVTQPTVALKEECPVDNELRDDENESESLSPVACSSSHDTGNSP